MPPIEISVTRHDSAAVVAPSGTVDTRTAPEFERTLLGLAAEGTCRFVVDLGGVTLLTSAGIRVLVMLGKRVRIAEGALALCGLNPHVRSVFEVSGLLPLFTIVGAADEALALVAPARPHGEPSKLARTVLRLLAVGEPADRTVAASQTPPGLSALVAAALRSKDDEAAAAS
jgi:stage II sporulation protein AA (anti-sigma F factor antagonist)